MAFNIIDIKKKELQWQIDLNGISKKIDFTHIHAPTIDVDLRSPVVFNALIGDLYLGDDAALTHMNPTLNTSFEFGSSSKSTVVISVF